MSDKILVHADGGPCHGTPLINNRCPGCGIAPDMQSAELWSVDLLNKNVVTARPSVSGAGSPEGD